MIDVRTYVSASESPRRVNHSSRLFTSDQQLQQAIDRVASWEDAKRKGIPFDQLGVSEREYLQAVRTKVSERCLAVRPYARRSHSM